MGLSAFANYLYSLRIALLQKYWQGKTAPIIAFRAGYFYHFLLFPYFIHESISKSAKRKKPQNGLRFEVFIKNKNQKT